MKELEAASKAANDASQKKVTENQIVVVTEPEQGAAEPQISIHTPTAPVHPQTGEDLTQTDTPDVPMRPAEKKRLDWRGKTCKSSPSKVVSVTDMYYQTWLL